MTDILFWGILAVLTFGVFSTASINPFVPWIATVIVLLVVWVIGSFRERRSSSR